MIKTLFTKTSTNGKYYYSLVKFADKYVIFKNQVSAKATFAEKLEFSDETKARNFFEKI